MFSNSRYNKMEYNLCGASGLKLPTLSLGLWHNFSTKDDYLNAKEMIRRAFDLGITHFDLANNYGPPPGAAEITFGQILKSDLAGYREEIIISTKAGYEMWPGPYGDGGSRKYLISSINQSLKRLGLDYVDIFYHHCPDPETPLEETMSALDAIVRSGKALYVGLSSYSPEQTGQAAKLLNDLGTPCLIHQPVYNMFNRWIEKDLLSVIEKEKLGCIVFSPLAQGLLTERYLNGIPDDSRAARPTGYLRPESITAHKLQKIQLLHNLAKERGQKLSHMALAWVLRHKTITSALVGASRVTQIEECLGALESPDFTTEELKKIDEIIQD